MSDSQDSIQPGGPSGALSSLQARVFFLTWLSYASYYLTRKNYSVVKTTLQNDFGLTKMDLGNVDSLYLTAYALGQFICGALGDRYGAKKMLVFGMFATATASLVFGLGSAFLIFLFAFGINGLFQSSGWPNNVKAMSRWFSIRVRGFVMGFWTTNYQVGGLVATALATFLLANHGWRTAFFVPAVWVAFVGALLLFLLVEKPQDKGLEIPGPETKPVNAADQVKASKPPFLEMISQPIVLGLGTAYLGLKLIRYSLLFWLPYYNNKALGYNVEEAGYLSMMFEVGGIAGAITTGWVSDRFFPGKRAKLAAPMMFMLAGALFLFQRVGSTGEIPYAISMALVGFFLFGPDTLVAGAAAQDAGGDKASGSAAGIINGIGSVGGALSGVITAYVTERWDWERLFYVFVAVAIVAGTALLMFSVFTRKSEE
ncbi:MAG: MFS transporter [Planctomycetota bacterium]|jgi:sugar phosphate permease|nr:MFS transporter [Planctomycetota bacterium]MDP7129330.1 MFS transporter [Planctomycetota bacterium]MDP7249724.1 MFS transporter [Planctomycetota bacterium]